MCKAIYCKDDCKLLQDDINCTYSWTDSSLLVFHPAKCKQMRIGTLTIDDFTYTMGPQQVILEKSVAEKDVGVIIDCNLSFEAHMTEKNKKANATMGMIRRTFEYLDERSFCTLFKALVRPHLEYANQIWATFLKKHITSIEKVQRRATKLIPGFRDLEYSERLTRVGLPTLAYRRMRGGMIELYKITTGKYDTVRDATPNIPRGPDQRTPTQNI